MARSAGRRLAHRGIRGRRVEGGGQSADAGADARDGDGAAAGKQRDAFFSSSGYYTVGQIKQAKFAPAKLVSIGDSPGSLSRFSVDLYREYEAIARSTATRPVTAHARNQ